MGRIKFKMQKMITYLCVVVSILTILVGLQGLRIIKASNENTQYMYGYYNWSKNIEEIEINLTNMQLNRVKAERSYESTYQENINVNNVNIMKNYNDYMSTENESEEENKYLSNIETFYGDYYKLTTEALDTLKNGGTLSTETSDKLVSLETNLQVNITGIKKYLANWAETDKADMDKMYVRTKFLYIGIIAVCMAISIGAGLYVANLSSRHVRELKKSLRKGKVQKSKKEDGNESSIPTGIDGIKEIQEQKQREAERIKEQTAEFAKLNELKAIREKEEEQARREMQEAEDKAKKKELELRREVEAYKARIEAEGQQVRQEAEQQQARREAEELKARQEAEELQGRQASEELKARQEAEELQARQEAEELQARQAAEELKARRKAEKLRAKKEAEELKARQEAEKLRAKREAEELRARQEAEKLKAKKEAEELKAMREAEKLKAKKEAEELKARQEAEKLRAKKEAEELKARQEAEKLQAKKEAEELKAKQEAVKSEEYCVLNDSKVCDSCGKCSITIEKEEKIQPQVINNLDGLEDLEDLEDIKEIFGLEGISTTRELELLEELGELE